MDYDPTNKGVLFDEKIVKSDKHPVKTGKLNVEGKEYRIAAWEKKSKSGTPFLSLAISEPKPQHSTPTNDREFQESLAKSFDGEGEPIDLSSIPF